MKTRLLPLLLLVANGCADPPPTLSIECFTSPDPANCGNAVTATCSRLAGTAVLDVQALAGQSTAASIAGYLAYPVITNLVHSTIQMGNTRGADVTLTRLEVKLKGTPGVPWPDAFKAIGTFSIPLNGLRLLPDGANLVTQDVGLVRTSDIKALLPSLGQGGWDNVVVAEVRAVGIMAGSEIKGTPVDLPIKLCQNCLLPAATCPAAGIPAASIQQACILGQDTGTTCCADSQGQLLCGNDVPKTKT